MIDNLLTQYDSNREEFKQLFDISERTYQRWNKKPPEWTIKLFKLTKEKKPTLHPCWTGWHHDRDFIVDPDGNGYHVDEIRAIFWNRQLINTLTSKRPSNIRSLKQHLDARIKETKATLNISLDTDTDTLKTWKIQI